jgi:diguanylate cyclase (GGDEF)-like protein
VSFCKRFLVPITLILLSASTALIAGLYAMTHQQDARERHREEQVVALALAGQIDGLQKVLREYARWDDAAAHAVTSFDPEWIDEQFGVYLYESNGYEANFIVDDEGRTLYAAVHGKRTADAAAIQLGRDYRLALTRAVAQPPGADAAVTGLSVGARAPLLFAVHRIGPSPGSTLPPGAPRRYMVVAKDVDDQLATDLGQAAQLSPPRLVGQADPRLAAVPVRTYAGSTIGYYAWPPTTPGSELRRSSMPILGGFVLVLLGLGGIVLRNASTDLRELQASEAKAQHLARHDALTGLPNRRAFNERLVKLGGLDAVYSVLVIDLDGFKEVNDSFGHATGDLLLRRTSERLRRALPPHAYLARPGGDEFFVAWEHGPAALDHGVAATAIVEAVREPHAFQAEPITVGCSVGIAGGEGLECADVVRRADVAMYAAKSRGRDNWCHYSPTLDDGRRERRQLESDLRRAIAAGEISVAFQPIVRSRSGRSPAWKRWRDGATRPAAPSRRTCSSRSPRTAARSLSSGALSCARRACARGTGRFSYR